MTFSKDSENRANVIARETSASLATIFDKLLADFKASIRSGSTTELTYAAASLWQFSRSAGALFKEITMESLKLHPEDRASVQKHAEGVAGEIAGRMKAIGKAGGMDEAPIPEVNTPSPSKPGVN